jgi:trimeric autotransporter adhesin
VRDRNHDGVINDGRELYGSGTVGEGGQRAGHGFAALAAEDSNHDGKLTVLDKHFKDLQLWVDADHDGKTDLGELHGLAELGVVSLDTGFVRGDRSDQGNLLGLVGSYKTADGEQHEMVDVWFAKQRGDDKAPPALDELLAAPAPELLGSPAASATPVVHAEAAAPVGGGSHHRGLFDDEHRQHPLI